MSKPGTSRTRGRLASLTCLTLVAAAGSSHALVASGPEGSVPTASVGGAGLVETHFPDVLATWSGAALRIELAAQARVAARPQLAALSVDGPEAVIDALAPVTESLGLDRAAGPAPLRPAGVVEEATSILPLTADEIARAWPGRGADIGTVAPPQPDGAVSLAGQPRQAVLGGPPGHRSNAASRAAGRPGTRAASRSAREPQPAVPANGSAPASSGLHVWTALAALLIMPGDGEDWRRTALEPQ